MTARLAAGALAYAAVVFGAGFILGTVRVLVLEPLVGPLWAVALELPVMLGISFVVARRIVGWRVIGDAAPALLMGVVAAVLLAAAETLLGVVLGQPPAVQFAGYGTLRGVLGLVGLAGFALMPLLAQQRFSKSGRIPK